MSSTEQAILAEALELNSQLKHAMDTPVAAKMHGEWSRNAKAIAADQQAKQRKQDLPLSDDSHSDGAGANGMQGGGGRNGGGCGCGAGGGGGSVGSGHNNNGRVRRLAPPKQHQQGAGGGGRANYTFSESEISRMEQDNLALLNRM